METLDACGRRCPIPLFYVKKRIEKMEPGNKLEITVDDTVALETIPRWCRLHKHKVIEILEDKKPFKILIQKS